MVQRELHHQKKATSHHRVGDNSQELENWNTLYNLQVVQYVGESFPVT